jgi:hypothetical protein
MEMLFFFFVENGGSSQPPIYEGIINAIKTEDGERDVNEGCKRGKDV